MRLPIVTHVAGTACLLLAACTPFEGHWSEAELAAYNEACSARFAEDEAVSSDLRRLCEWTGTQLSRRFETYAAYQAVTLTPAEEREIFTACNFTF